MKKHLFICLLVSLARTLSSQVNTDEIKKASEETTKKVEALEASTKNVSKQIDSLKNFILKNLDDSKSKVGILAFRTPDLKVDVYGPNSDAITYTVSIPNNATECKCSPDYEKKIIMRKNKERYLRCTPRKTKVLDKKLKIDSVVVRLSDGAIMEIQVLGRTDDKGPILKFSNANGPPIILTSERFTKENALFSDQDKNVFIKLNEVLLYVPFKSFFPDNEIFTLTDYKKEHLFDKSSGLNSWFDVRLYTDGLGVFGGKANGIAQVDVNGNFAVGRRSYRKTGIRFLKYVGFNLNSTKFDSKLAYTAADASFSRTSLFRKNWLSAEGYFSPLAGSLAKTSDDIWFFNLGFGFDFSQLAYKTDTVSSLSSFISGQLGVRFELGDNFGFEASTKYYYHVNQDSKELRYKEGDRGFIKPQIGGYWYPLGNKNNKIFARFNFVTDIHEVKYQFAQLQFGYSLLLGDLVKK